MFLSEITASRLRFGEVTEIDFSRFLDAGRRGFATGVVLFAGMNFP